MDINFEIDDKSSDEVLNYILENLTKELIAFKTLKTAFKLCDDLGLDDADDDTGGSHGYTYNLICLFEGKLQEFIGKEEDDLGNPNEDYDIIFDRICGVVHELDNLDVLEYLCGKIKE